VFTLQTIPAWDDDDRFAQVAKESGLLRASCPSGQLKRFKIVPDDFVAPNSRHRVDVTPAKRGKGTKYHESDGKTPQQRHRQSCCQLRGPHPIQTGLQSYGSHTSLNGTAT
jgi:hypothetical protein